MLKFEKVSIQNFMSIGEAEVDLSKGGFTLISAENHRVEDAAKSNGSGKSSIGESIVWALTGETIRGHKEVVNRYTIGDCLVSVFFSFKDHQWVVKRGMDRSKGKTLEIIKDGHTLPSKGYRDAQDVFLRELPEITFKFLNSVVILGQGLPGRFTNNSPAGRKAVLEELTNADYMIEQVKEGIATRQTFLSTGLRVAEDGRLTSQTQKRTLSEAIEGYQKDLASYSTFDEEAEKKALEELAEEGKSLKRDFDEAKAEADFLKEKKTEVALKISETRSKYEKKIEGIRTEAELKKKELQAEVDSYISSESSKVREAHVANISELKEFYSKAKLEVTTEKQNRLMEIAQLIPDYKNRVSTANALLTQEICPTCGQRMPGLSDSDLEKAREEVEVAGKTLNNLYEEKNDVEREISDLSKEIDSKLQSEIHDSKVKTEKLFEQIQGVADRMKADNEKVIQEILSGISGVQEAMERDLVSLNEEGRIINEKHLVKCSVAATREQNLEDARKRYSQKRDFIIEVKNRIDYITERLNESQAKLSEVEQAIQDYSAKVDEYTSRLDIVKKMATFASRDFRGILLEEVIHRLDTIFKGYSQKVYGNELANFYQDGNAIVVEFDGKEYESLSGGEQQKINVLLQLSLRDLIIELTGVTGSFILLDEVFDGLDYQGCEKMINLFQTLDTSVWVITHHEESLMIPYDYELRVVKEPDGVARVEIA